MSTEEPSNGVMQQALPSGNEPQPSEEDMLDVGMSYGRFITQRITMPSGATLTTFIGPLAMSIPEGEVEVHETSFNPISGTISGGDGCQGPPGYKVHPWQVAEMGARLRQKNYDQRNTVYHHAADMEQLQDTQKHRSGDEADDGNGEGSGTSLELPVTFHTGSCARS
ncbi:hypothetical protein CALCODRAFT_510144 [Calocera cornea HHB12733]|uniref:Uncharacterized protein n=1 Tax=Calocera cornea HHB12733 TaxID=1353952 RepID=A0A165ESE8_9BASI|nr:hypothetical protein CALCODRAFT_510144 [Calocera cornea HHB12733]